MTFEMEQDGVARRRLDRVKTGLARSGILATLDSRRRRGGECGRESVKERLEGRK